MKEKKDVSDVLKMKVNNNIFLVIFLPCLFVGVIIT